MKHNLIIYILAISFSVIQAQTTINIPTDYNTIQGGLNVAQNGDTVLVQPGVYNENIMWPNKSNIKLLATGDSSNTIIDGRNMGSVITIVGTGQIDSNTIISGFTITRGSQSQYGGGIFLNGASPKLRALYFKNNNSTYAGGGLCVYDANLYLENSKFFNNSASSPNALEGMGGAIYIFNNPTPFIYNIENCMFVNNQADYLGGAICEMNYGRIDSSLISNCRFISNEITRTIDSYGGAIYTNQSKIIMENCEFDNNKTASGGTGGAVYNWESDLRIEDSKFTNSYAVNGGAIRTYYNTKISNSLFLQNIAACKGGAILFSKDLLIENTRFVKNATTIIENNLPDDGGGVIYGASTVSNMEIKGSDFVQNSSIRGGVIYLVNCTNGTIEQSNLVNNVGLEGSGGIYISDNCTLRIEHSNFIKNSKAIYNSSNLVYVSASSNYWGSISGPFHPAQNPGGLGDSVNMFVNITPWLTNIENSAPLLPVQNLHKVSCGASSIEFSWDSSPNSQTAGYKIYYNVDSLGYPYLNIVDVGTTTNYNLTNLSQNDKYYVVITAYDNLGNESWYSDEVVAQTLQKPLSPALLSPSDNSVSIVNPLTFVWSTSQNTQKYIIEISKDYNYTNVILVDSILTDTSYTTTGLSSQTTYFWHIKAVNVGGESQWSSTYTFRTLGDPNTCNLLYPQNNSYYINTTNLKFIWTKATEMKSIQNYHFMLARDQQFTEIMSNDSLLIDTNKVVNNLLNNTIYYWKTRAKNQVGWGNWSTVNNFRTRKKNISSPTELNSSLLVSSTVKLTWVDESNNETGFYIYRKLGDSLSTSDLIIIDSVGLNIQTFIDTTVSLNNTFTYLVSAFNTDTASGYSNSSTIAVTIMDEFKQTIPTKYSLDQNYPNPFNPSTTISFGLPKQEFVTLKIYDVLGKEVTTLVNEEMSAGNYTKTWDAKDLSSGIYLYKLNAGKFTETKKMILVR